MDNPSKSLQSLFAAVPRAYELANRILTLGLDRVWRSKAARLSASRSGRRWLDMCCGTGDMCRLLDREIQSGAIIVGVDFSLPMLKQAKRANTSSRTFFVAADIDALPFAPGAFDHAAASFALRNLNFNRARFTERLGRLQDLLTPGGSLTCVETSRPRNRFVRKCMHLYVAFFVSFLGGLISGNRKPYAYLASTIPRFYGPDEFRAVLKEAGFDKVRALPLSFGVAAIHSAETGIPA